MKHFPDYPRYYTTFAMRRGQVADGMVGMAMDGGAPIVYAMAMPAPPGAGFASPPPPPKIRKEFPETWMFDSVSDTG